MISAGIQEQDAINYVLYGCNWPTIPGKQGNIDIVVWGLPIYLLRALKNNLPAIHSMEDLYKEYEEAFRKEQEATCCGIQKKRSILKSSEPGFLQVDDCFLERSVENACSWEKGNIKYHTYTCSLGSIATTADAFTAIEELVFKKKVVSLEDFVLILNNDYEGNEPLRQQCLNLPKFGQDDERADKHAVRILETSLKVIDEFSMKGTNQEIIILPCLQTDMDHIMIGKGIGATPDGRHASEAISENTSPVSGACFQGLTAMFRSLSKLPFKRICSGALNVRISPNLVKGKQGLNLFSSLIRTYMNMGGLQVQISVLDTEQLKRAQAEPEKYRDLMVRVTGYSARFVDMSPQAQAEIIQREEMVGC